MQASLNLEIAFLFCCRLTVWILSFQHPSFKSFSTSLPLLVSTRSFWWWWWWYSKHCNALVTMEMMMKLTQHFSQYDLDRAFVDKSPAGHQRPDGTLDNHIGDPAFSGWYTPYDHPATCLCQSWPTPNAKAKADQRPSCSQQTTKILPKKAWVGPYKAPHILLPLLLLLDPELPLAIV